MDERIIILNLGGEGENPNAIDLNDLSFTRLTRSMVLKKSRRMIIGNMRQMPFCSGVADIVMARLMPFFDFDEWTGDIARESFRLLKPGGLVRFHSLTTESRGWLHYLTAAGFINVEVEHGFAIGDRP